MMIIMVMIVKQDSGCKTGLDSNRLSFQHTTANRLLLNADIVIKSEFYGGLFAVNHIGDCLRRST